MRTSQDQYSIKPASLTWAIKFRQPVAPGVRSNRSFADEDTGAALQHRYKAAQRTPTKPF
jgi:hypothetical protein